VIQKVVPLQDVPCFVLIFGTMFQRERAPDVVEEVDSISVELLQSCLTDALPPTASADPNAPPVVLLPHKDRLGHRVHKRDLEESPPIIGPLVEVFQRIIEGSP
jgi:hypothetical protein